MSRPVDYTDRARRLEAQFGVRRGVLLGVEVVCLVLGALAIALPMR
jgi:hypothetical protein